MGELERRTVSLISTLLLVFLFLSGVFWYSHAPAPTTTNVGTWKPHAGGGRGRQTTQDHLTGHFDDINANTPWTTVPRTFGQMRELEDLSRRGDAAWAVRTSTRGGGFLTVRYNATMTQGYGVSMFHALHCLQMIRFALQAHTNEDRAGDGDMVDHADHRHHTGGDGAGGGGRGRGSDRGNGAKGAILTTSMLPIASAMLQR
ncbi:hypothetical protein AYL99_10443 [Fonsecaea erecta]|uniref:Uncharacterized protein n=1 Tax=Fonsecaea erecta TaxID=1367422 RepID=A0A178Z6R7_9EURO|nr:hypothetical protein AYL99_10443 [Fonsecaea erecta]OAP55470.1 hypothetical protein AYL99_10443 [Fonsecaea erecta]